MIPDMCPKTAPAQRTTGTTTLPAVAAKRLTGHRRRQPFDGNDEPRLDDVLADPIVRSLLASDGILLADLEDLVSDVRFRLDRRRKLS